MAYGLEGIYLTITKMIVILGIAVILDCFKELLILLLSFNIIRTQAFGIHASKSSYCLISSILLFIGGALFCKYVNFHFIVMVIISIIGDVCLFLYAPADTHKRPLVNVKKRKRFKLLSFIFGITYTLLIIIFKNNLLVRFLLVGKIIAVIMILPLTYKIFKLPYNNYKTYNYGV